MPTPSKKTKAAPEVAAVDTYRACGHCGRIEGDFDACGSVVLCPMKNGQEPRTLGPQDTIVACSVEGCGFRRALSATQAMRDVRVKDAGCDRSQETCGAYFETIGVADASDLAVKRGGAVDGEAHQGG